MRKLIVTNIMSLDGYYEGPGRDVMVLPMDQSFDAHNAERLRSADTVLLSGTSFGLFEGFWPQMAQHPDATPTQREISRLMDAIPKLVVSNALTNERTGSWRDTTRIVRRAEAHAQIAALKRQPGKDILIFGSRALWNDLLAAGLVDELQLVVGCLVLGGGTPAFDRPSAGRFRLLEARRWEGSDNVVLRYAVGDPAR